MSNLKVLNLDELAQRVNWARLRGESCVLAHGCWDLLHLGHVRHLQAARCLGHVLAVTVTPDVHVREQKGGDRPAFRADERAEMLAALECVSCVAVSRWPTAVEVIRQLRPAVFVKGREYAERMTEALLWEQEALRACGGRLEFVSNGVQYSSSKLLQRIGAA